MKILKNIGSIFADIIIGLLVLIIIVNVFFISSKDDKHLPSLFGYKFLVDLTDSMLPEISSGDLIIIKEYDRYKPDDIVAYRNKKGELITHRIISVEKRNGNEFFQVKGDRNTVKDNDLVKHDDIEGKYIKKISRLGRILLFLKSVYGIVFLLVLLICYVTFLIIKEKYFN